MNLHNSSFLTTAVKLGQYPSLNLPEIALCGRSNVGKSSFINKLLNRKNLARTSSKPGKTATLNFYNIDSKLLFVDLPGYGYAAVSKTEKERWGRMINEYLTNRPELVCGFLLVDARHEPSVLDVQMLSWLRARKQPIVCVATKCDKCKKSQLDDNLQVIWDKLELNEDDVLLPFSAETGLGVPDAWTVINELIQFQ